MNTRNELLEQLNTMQNKHIETLESRIKVLQTTIKTLDSTIKIQENTIKMLSK